jgi:hypothetical protein
MEKIVRYQIVKDRYQKLIDEFDKVKDDIQLIKLFRKIREQIEFDEDCLLHGH